MSELIIRLSRPDDVEDIRSIYNTEVTEGTATFDIHPRSTEDRLAWLNAHNRPGEGHPLIVAETGGRDSHVIGYASLSAYREKDAYRSTVELSVYVSRAHRQKGVGSALMAEIIRLAKEDPTVHAVVSVITEGNAVSEKLHEKFGFTYCGRIPEVGVKFGKYLGIVQYVLIV